MTRAACTIVSPNYLPFARTLAGSYVAQHPDQRFFVLIVADLHDPAPFRIDASFTPVMLGEIGLPDLRGLGMKYDILELNTNVKPTLMKHLIEQYGLDALVYLDPDIFVYRPLDPVFQALEEGASAVLTPHMTAPVFDGKAPSEQDLLYNGTYNLGFIGVGCTEESLRLLDWWEHRCLHLGFSEGRTGLFVDQKWMNLAPGLFENVVVCRDPGLNMAYWNLHERTLEKGKHGMLVQGLERTVPLRFFHFSGLDSADAEVISRNTDRFTLAERPDLREVFAGYRTALAANQGDAAEALPYGFDQFSDGTAVTRLARRLYSARQERFQGDPFDARGEFARFARKQRLVKGKVKAAKSTWKEFNPKDRRVGALHRLLRVALRVLGPHRYELLMRYLAHISVLRHQSVFLRDPQWSNSASNPKPR